MPKGIYQHVKRPICKRGHDTAVVGRGKIGDCSKCRVIKNQNFGWLRAGIINSDGTRFTIIDYDRAYQIQQGRCANLACNKHQTEYFRRFDVDHDHKTGMFRGLLCTNCNQTIGMSREDKNILKGLIQYLESFHGIH